jgi:hypothetical protein
MMKRLALIAALALAACDAQTPPPYFARAKAPAQASMEALARGTLELRDGCVWLAPESGGGAPLLVVWPAETQMQHSAETTRFRNEASGSGATIGKRIEISGGQVQTLPVDALAEPIPTACAAGPFWIAGPTWTVER